MVVENITPKRLKTYIDKNPVQLSNEPVQRTEETDESQTTQGSREDVTQTTEPETDRTPAEPVLPTETPIAGSEQASEGVEVDTTGVSESADLTYHGATFTEEGGKLSITGDQIPESFWNYYHSGGRGRNSAHKRAMKDAGWEYTFRGKPRIYTFSITVDRFNAWRLANPDDGSPSRRTLRTRFSGTGCDAGYLTRSGYRDEDNRSGQPLAR